MNPLGYGGLAPFYNEFFKPAPAFIQWAKIAFTSKSNLLDMGCGTGSHLWVLQELSYRAIGIDLSYEMLQESPVHPVIQANSCSLPFRKASFDGGLCLGNTLSHLTPNQVRTFFLESSRVLKQGADLFIQVMNWEKIQESGITFPLLRTGKLEFLRSYEFFNQTKEDFFSVPLLFHSQVKQAGHIICQSQSRLYPLSTRELFHCADQAGFTLLYKYQNFALEPFSKDSQSALLHFQRKTKLLHS